MSRVSVVVQVVALATAVVAVAAFGTAVPLALVAAVLVALALERSSGAVVAALGAVALAAVVIYVSAGVSNAVGTPLEVGVGIGMLGMGTAAVVVSRGALPKVPSWSDVAAVALMPTAWAVLVSTSFWWPGASTRSWAMQGDTANNVLFARDVVAAGGAPFVGENPVPFPHVVLGLTMTSDHSSAPEAAAVDLTGYALAWHGVLILNVLLVGLLARSIVRTAGAPRRVVSATTVAAGAIPFSWLYSGYAIDSGFFNTHIAMAVLLASTLAALERRRLPVLTLAIQGALATVLIVTWTPLVVVVGVQILVGVAGLVRARVAGEWPAAPRTHWWLAGASVAILATRFGLFLKDYLGTTGDTTASAGGIAPPPLAIAALLAAGPLALIALGMVARRRALGAAVDLGIAQVTLIATYVLLVLIAGDPALYYPQKLLWMLIGFGLVITPPLVVVYAGGLGSARARRSLGLAALAGALALSVSGTVVSLASPSRGTLDPWVRILAGQADGGEDHLYQAVVHLASDDRILLNVSVSSDVDADANFWSINLFSQRFPEASDERFELRWLGYLQPVTPTHEWLCALPAVAHAPVHVSTGDPDLESRVRATCPTSDVTVGVVSGAQR